MSLQQSHSLDTTCTARVVDGLVRGGAAGALYGLFLSGNARYSGTLWSKRRAVRKMVGRYASTGALFVGIYSGVHCAMTSVSGGSRTVAAGLAGAAAGSFVAARSAVPPRQAAITVLMCGAASVVVGALDGREDRAR